MPEDQLLAELIAKAIQPLQDRISSLEATIAHLQEENAALTTTQATLSDNQLIQLQLIKRFKEAVKEEPEEDSPLIDELYKEMKAIGRKQTDFATAARMVKRSKARLFQLKPAIALDPRFILIPSESHSQKILIRLREFYKTV